MKIPLRISLSNLIAKKIVYKRCLSWVIICCFCCLSIPEVLANDYPLISDWAKNEALLAEQQGLLPQERLYGDLREEGRRAQAARYLVQLTEVLLQKRLPNNAKGIFSDMDGVWSNTADAAERAYSAGIVMGYENNRFNPRDAITREQYATMIFRMFQYIERETSEQILPQNPLENCYVDSASISLWAKDAIDTLSVMGVFCGNTDGRFNPNGVMSLEQMIVVSYRCWEYCVKLLR